MTSPHARIHRYFVIRQAGTPSSTIQLEYAAAVSCRDHEAPAWLIRHCEVGDAIESLPNGQQRAVERRWRAIVLLEECTRAIRTASTRELECRREGKDAREWVTVAKEAEAHAQWAEKAMREGRMYREGMDGLIILLTRSEEG
jgi:hypothetical protein